MVEKKCEMGSFGKLFIQKRWKYAPLVRNKKKNIGCLMAP